MGTRLETFPPRPARYPWHEWADGSPWHLERGVDFAIEPVAFTQVVHGWANRNRYSAQTSVRGDDVYIQMTKVR
jgi:hypothetical protein